MPVRRKRSASMPQRMGKSKSKPLLKARVAGGVQLKDGAAKDDWTLKLKRAPKSRRRAPRISDAVHRKYPEWSLFPRRPVEADIVALRSPGPVYAVKDKYVKHRSPVWSLGRRWSMPAQPRRSPGPVYLPNPDSVLYVPPKWSIYGRTKDKSLESCSPGPIYKPKLPKTCSALMNSRLPDWEKYKSVNTPGPAAYDGGKIDYCRASTKRNVIIVSRTKTNDEIQKSRMPGPAKYVPIRGMTSTDPPSKRYTMGKRLPEKLLADVTPGPGSYGPEIMPRFNLKRHIRRQERASKRAKKRKEIANPPAAQDASPPKRRKLNQRFNPADLDK